jgi:hypothetical protein
MVQHQPTITPSVTVGLPRASQAYCDVGSGGGEGVLGGDGSGGLGGARNISSGTRRRAGDTAAMPPSPPPKAAALDSACGQGQRGGIADLSECYHHSSVCDVIPTRKPGHD